MQGEEFGLMRATFFLMMGCNSLSVVSSCSVKYYGSKLRAMKKNVVTHYSHTTKIQTTIITPKQQHQLHQFSSTWPNDHDQHNLHAVTSSKKNLQILLQYAAQHVVTFSKHSVLLNAEQSTQRFLKALRICNTWTERHNSYRRALTTIITFTSAAKQLHTLISAPLMKPGMHFFASLPYRLYAICLIFSR